MLRPNLTDHPVSDFRHWEPWRVLTPIVADELIRFSGQDLVAPQTVLEEDVDTTRLTPEQVADHIWDLASERIEP